jgi:ATP-dependent RNA helicase RhlE
VLVPTRELAAQVEQSNRADLRRAPAGNQVGDDVRRRQHQSADRPSSSAASTSSSPRRAACSTTCNRSTVDLSGVEILVLDEADRMLDMGFIRDIRRVLALLPRQAPEPAVLGDFLDEIRGLAEGLLHDPA